MIRNKKYIFDTNVAIVANGATENVCKQCILNSVTVLSEAINKGIILVDLNGDIQNEYRRHLNASGQPGVGDRFYQEVINSSPSVVCRVELDIDLDGEYLDLPEAIRNSKFDPSDRKFAALSAKTDTPVYNCVDSDWVEHIEIIRECDLKVEFVCGADPSRWRI